MTTPTLVWWRGKRFTPRMRDQLVEAQKLNGGVRLTPTQGSFSNGVGASAGTHAREAIDLSVRGMSTADENATIRNLRTVGIWASVRPAIPGLWPRHIHGIPVGGDLSPQAKAQVDEARKGGDGLKGNAPDPHAWMKLPVVTWQEYLDHTWPLPKGHVFGDKAAIPRWNISARRRVHDGTANAREARWVRRIKRAFSIEGGPNRYGPVTANAVGLWQKRNGVGVTKQVGLVTARKRGLLG
jgi:hypothetical protein